jgi:hypothetical protein
VFVWFGWAGGRAVVWLVGLLGAGCLACSGPCRGGFLTETGNPYMRAGCRTGGPKVCIPHPQETHFWGVSAGMCLFAAGVLSLEVFRQQQAEMRAVGFPLLSGALVEH